MKKFLLAAALATTSAGTAFAGSINYDFRGDYQSATYNSDALAVPGTKNADFNKFYFKIGRVDFKGNLNEDTSYRLRWAFYGSPTYTTRDNVNTQIQFAYISQKLGAGFNLSLGKVGSDIGGFEGAMSGADLYLVSESYSHSFGSDRLLSRTYGTGDSAILYMTGAKLDYTFMDAHTFSLVGLNPPQDETIGGKFQQNVFWYGLTYKGSFLEKALSVIASYHEGNSVNAPAGSANSNAGPYNSDDKTKMYAAGVKWDSNPILVSAEYIGQQADYKTTGSFTDKMDSFVLKAAWTAWEQWTPRLEFTSSQEKIDNISATNKFTGYGAIVEFKPRKDDVFRYHLAYQNITEKPETGSDLNRQEIVAGVRLFGDFLK